VTNDEQKAAELAAMRRKTDEELVDVLGENPNPLHPSHRAAKRVQ